MSELDARDFFFCALLTPFVGLVLVFGLLDEEESLLGFDFSAEFFFGGEVEFVFAGKELLVAVKYKVAGNVFVGFRT